MALPEYESLKQMVTEVEDDLNKAIGGNKAAGTRVRKKMQEIKSEAQKIRQRILENREGETGSEASEESTSAEQS
jgi:vacuolar-type H+-ATPase subunit H